MNYKQSNIANETNQHIQKYLIFETAYIPITHELIKKTEFMHNEYYSAKKRKNCGIYRKMDVNYEYNVQ